MSAGANGEPATTKGKYMNVHIAARNTTDTESSRLITRPWLAFAGLVAVVTVAVGTGAVLQDGTTTEQVAAFSPGLTDSIVASGQAPQAGLPDGVWLAEESAAASDPSIAVGIAPQAGLPDGFWMPEASASAEHPCGTRGPC